MQLLLVIPVHYQPAARWGYTPALCWSVAPLSSLDTFTALSFTPVYAVLAVAFKVDFRLCAVTCDSCEGAAAGAQGPSPQLSTTVPTTRKKQDLYTVQAV